jgi:TolB-like protein
MSVWSEMKRRHVFRVMFAYVVVGVATGGAAESFLPNLGAPVWVLPTVLVLLILGLPVTLVLAWAYEMTPSGIVRDAGAGEVVEADKGGQSIPGEQAVVEVDHNSIAVLPFADMSPNGDQEYFGDGIAEEFINALVKIPGFSVAARTSSFRFRGEKTDVREIGRELGVSAVLEGSVRKEGDQLRVTAQLVSVHDGYHLWSDTYDRNIEHIFAIQDELARAIVERVQGHPRRRLSRARAGDEQPRGLRPLSAGQASLVPAVRGGARGGVGLLPAGTRSGSRVRTAAYRHLRRPLHR